jgi:hypothetical protein
MLTQKPKQLLLKRQQWQPLEWLDYVVSFKCNNRALAVCWVPGCSRSTLPIPYSLQSGDPGCYSSCCSALQIQLVDGSRT